MCPSFTTTALFQVLRNDCPKLLLTDGIKLWVKQIRTKTFGSFICARPVRKAFQHAPSKEEYQRLLKIWAEQRNKQELQEDVITFFLLLARYFARMNGTAFVKKEHCLKALGVLRCPLSREAIRKWLIHRPSGEQITLIEIVL